MLSIGSGTNLKGWPENYLHIDYPGWNWAIIVRLRCCSWRAFWVKFSCPLRCSFSLWVANRFGKLTLGHSHFCSNRRCLWTFSNFDCIYYRIFSFGWPRFCQSGRWARHSRTYGTLADSKGKRPLVGSGQTPRSPPSIGQFTKPNFWAFTNFNSISLGESFWCFSVKCPRLFAILFKASWIALINLIDFDFPEIFIDSYLLLKLVIIAYFRKSKKLMILIRFEAALVAEAERSSAWRSLQEVGAFVGIWFNLIVICICDLSFYCGSLCFRISNIL